MMVVIVSLFAAAVLRARLGRQVEKLEALVEAPAVTMVGAAPTVFL